MTLGAIAQLAVDVVEEAAVAADVGVALEKAEAAIKRRSDRRRATGLGGVGRGGGGLYPRNFAKELTSGLTTSGLTGGTTTPLGAGPGVGVGSAKPNSMAVFLVSNASMVSGESIDSTSARWTPVEVPKGRVTRPAFT